MAALDLVRATPPTSETLAALSCALIQSQPSGPIVFASEMLNQMLLKAEMPDTSNLVTGFQVRPSSLLHWYASAEVMFSFAEP